MHPSRRRLLGQLLAYLLQQAERKYDPMRERGRGKRGAAVPAQPAETRAQLAVTDEPRATGGVVGAGGAVSPQADPSTRATGAPGEVVPATAARTSVAVGPVAGSPAPAPAAAGSVAAGPVAGSPAPTPAAAGPVDASFFTAAPAAAGPGVPRPDGPAPNWQAQAVAAPDSEQVRRDTPSSAQNQQPPRMPGRSGDRTPLHAPGSAAAGSPAPAVAGPGAARAGSSAPNRQAQAVAAPNSEQVRRDTPSSAPNRQAARAGNGPSRTNAELHCGVRARLLGDGTAARPPAPESARAHRGRRHIPEAVLRLIGLIDGTLIE